MCVHVCVNVLEQHVSREQSAKSEGTLRANLTRAFQFFITNRKKTASNIHATALRKEEIKFNIYRLVPWPVAHGSLCQAEREGERERERVRERVRERQTMRESVRESVCVCESECERESVCVCESECERELDRV